MLLLATLGTLRSGDAVFVCCSGLGCSGGVSNNPVACAALGDLYAATSGWAILGSNTGWSSAAAGVATDYCTFYGVTCISGTVNSMCVWHPALLCSVALIRLASHGCSYIHNVPLSGTIPASLGRLTALTLLCVHCLFFCVSLLCGAESPRLALMQWT